MNQLGVMQRALVGPERAIDGRGLVELVRADLAAEDLLARGEDAEFMQAKIATARFYAEHILAKAPGQRDSIVEGADSVTQLPLEAF